VTDVSIVIPAFNEAAKIAGDVEEAARFFDREGLSGEIVVADDGSTDGTSAAARSAKVPPSVRLKTVRLERNAGKGFALKTGILASSGAVVIFADSGTCVPYTDALPWVRRIRDGELDIAMASRRLGKTVIRRDQPLRRRVLGRAFRLAVIVIVGLPRRVTDSQCGFKVFAGDIARELFAGLETPGFLYELEIIIKALRSGYRVEEFPMTWTCDPDTRLRPASQARSIVKELFAVRRIVRRDRGRK
jgi:dolichyl-phosphate beta-glucosyltransferase